MNNEQATQYLAIMGEVKAKLPLLFALAIEKNTNTNKSVFINFSGHVNKLDITIGLNKDKPRTKILFEENWIEINPDKRFQPLDEAFKSLEKINKCIEFLNNLN